jgi:hypothetical protein
MPSAVTRPIAESALAVNGWFAGAEEHRMASSVLATLTRSAAGSDGYRSCWTVG